MASVGGGAAAAAAMASEAYLAGEAARDARELVAELCRHFYAQGWVTGTGGSITVKANDPAVPLADQLIVMSPSGVQKERMVAEDMYVLSADGKVLSAPVAKPWPHKPPKCTDCAPLFMKAYLMRGAGAVIHSHGMETCIATMLDPGAKEFRITHMEMIKGIKGHGYHDELVIPIIENTPYEYELTDSLSEAIAAYPKATAVLVRNHGIYVWGDSWINAKTQAECYHYLFDAAIKLYQLGIDWTSPEHVESMIKADRKITSLKQFQGHIWRTGFERKELQGVIFEDVPEVLKNWHASGTKEGTRTGIGSSHVGSASDDNAIDGNDANTDGNN